VRTFEQYRARRSNVVLFRNVPNGRNPKGRPKNYFYLALKCRSFYAQNLKYLVLLGKQIYEHKLTQSYCISSNKNCIFRLAMQYSLPFPAFTSFCVGGH
jgi:hypothetical protein